MTYLIYLITNIVFYFLLIKYLEFRYDKRKNTSYLIILGMISVITTSLLNVWDFPVVYTSSYLFFYFIIGHICFVHNTIKDYVYDLIYFILFIFIDSLCYFTVGLIYEGMNIPMSLFRSFAASIMLIFLSVIINKYIKRFFKIYELYEIPRFEILLFFLITSFNIFLILVFIFEYDTLENDFNELFVLGIIFGIVLLDLCVIHYLEYMARSYVLEKQILLEKKQAEMKSQHYIDLKKSNEEIRRIIHDFKNDYQVMYCAFMSGEPLLAEDIVDKINEEYNKVKTLYDTGNEILDIILEEKHKESYAKNIKFQAVLSELDLTFIDHYDVVTIFGNILDNAIEATECLINIDRYIQLVVENFHEMIVIKLLNNCDNNLAYCNRDLKSTKSKHMGYGLHNVLRSLSKYDGEFTIDISDGVCTVLIYIPIK